MPAQLYTTYLTHLQQLHYTLASRHLHGNAAACDRVNVERTPKVVDVYGVYHVPDIVQPNAPQLEARVLSPPSQIRFKAYGRLSPRTAR